MMEVEKALLSQSYQVPIYFTHESETMKTVLRTLENTQSANSALAGLYCFL